MYAYAYHFCTKRNPSRLVCGLQALSVSLEDESLDQETRQGMMHDVLNKLVQQNPALWEDPLYQAMLEHGRPSSPLDALLM